MPFFGEHLLLKHYSPSSQSMIISVLNADQELAVAKDDAAFDGISKFEEMSLKIQRLARSLVERVQNKMKIVSEKASKQEAICSTLEVSSSATGALHSVYVRAWRALWCVIHVLVHLANFSATKTSICYRGTPSKRRHNKGARTPLTGTAIIGRFRS